MGINEIAAKSVVLNSSNGSSKKSVCVCIQTNLKWFYSNPDHMGCHNLRDVMFLTMFGSVPYRCW